LGQNEVRILLKLSDVSASYGPIQALWNVSLEIGEGELVALLGANGAGKSTLVSVIVNAVAASSGRIWFQGRDITHARTEDIVASGISVVPEGRGILPLMTVMENLQLGAYHTRGDITERLQWLFAKFPVLAERKTLPAGMLSGGQQQIVAIARALVGSPKLIVMDEPSLGLAPAIVNEVFRILRDLRDEGMSILLAEQNARKALQVADRAYVFDLGRVVFEGPARELATDARLHEAYLGNC
jgi:branched-chain amino acid transport system ATP-binding protein